MLVEHISQPLAGQYFFCEQLALEKALIDCSRARRGRTLQCRTLKTNMAATSEISASTNAQEKAGSISNIEPHSRRRSEIRIKLPRYSIKLTLRPTSFTALHVTLTWPLIFQLRKAQPVLVCEAIHVDVVFWNELGKIWEAKKKRHEAPPNRHQTKKEGKKWKKNFSKGLLKGTLKVDEQKQDMSRENSNFNEIWLNKELRTQMAVCWRLQKSDPFGQIKADFPRLLSQT